VDDTSIVSAQIERQVRGDVEVVARCHLGLPAVVRVAPILEDGTPFPTRFWLTCPVARSQVSALESKGWVRAFSRRRAEDSGFRAACDAADLAYERERDAAVPERHSGPRPRGGVAGNGGGLGIKCLHAHLAHHLSGAANPIGAEVAAMIEPATCAQPCVGEERAD
jgi:hypothetical protein